MEENNFNNAGMQNMNGMPVNNQQPMGTPNMGMPMGQPAMNPNVGMQQSPMPNQNMGMPQPMGTPNMGMPAQPGMNPNQVMQPNPMQNQNMGMPEPMGTPNMGAPMGQPTMDPSQGMQPNSMQNPSVGMPAQPGMNPNMQGQPGMNPNPNPAPNNQGIALDKSDDEYVADYIGNNANKLMTKKFNFAAFFLGSGYYFFRKHFIFGLIYILSYYLVPFVMDKMGMQVTAMSGCILVINIVLAILFNKSYVSKARKNVSKIKAANAGSDSFTLSSILRKKGGTNVLLFFLGFIVLGLPAALGVESPLISVNIGGNVVNNGGTVDTTDDSGSEFIPSDGVIVYDDVDLATNVNITIPTGFEEGFMHSDTSYVYEYSFNEDGTKCDGFNCKECEIDLKTVKGFKTAKDFASKQASSNSTTVTETSINGIKWQNYKYDFMDYTNEYVTDKDGKVYVLTFEESEEGICKNYIDSTLNSFSFK